MKTHVLFLAGTLAVSSAAWGQNDPTPASPTPGTPEAPAAPGALAAPTNAVPAQTNAPASAVDNSAVEVKPAIVQPASSIQTNAALLEVARTNAANEVVPLIVIDDVPLVDAVKNLARQAGLNYLPDPKITTATNQPNVTMRLENV